MSLSILINVFIRDFRKQRKRMLLTLIAILWGTLSIMLLLAFGEGLRKQMVADQRGLGDGIVILWGGQTSIPFQGFGKGRRINLHPEDVQYIQHSMPEMETVAAEYIRWGAVVKYGDMILNERINGIYPSYKELRNFRPQMGGRMINELDMQYKRRVAFLGDSLQHRLMPNVAPEDAIGELIYINGTPFTVVGVMEHKLQMSSYQGPDEDVVAIPASAFETIFSDPWLDNIIYKPKSYDDIERVKSRLMEVMGAKYRFDPTDEFALNDWDLMEQAKAMYNMMLGIQIFLGILGFLTLLIAGVGVTNIMYVSIKERTREIGVKMAVGGRRLYILTQFIIEALGITFLGGIIGMAVAYVMTELFKMIPLDSEALAMLGRPTVSFEIGLIVVIILGIMGFLAGLFPAMKAASINPTEALRYE